MALIDLDLNVLNATVALFRLLLVLLNWLLHHVGRFNLEDGSWQDYLARVQCEIASLEGVEHHQTIFILSLRSNITVFIPVGEPNSSSATLLSTCISRCSLHSRTTSGRKGTRLSPLTHPRSISASKSHHLRRRTSPHIQEARWADSFFKLLHENIYPEWPERRVAAQRGAPRGEITVETALEYATASPGYIQTPEPR